MKGLVSMASTKCLKRGVTLLTVLLLPPRTIAMQTWILLALALWLPAGQTYPMYGEEIPNGDHVPHPCKPNFLWHGVGHRNSQGGGARNPFGEDFAANGHKWTAALCRLDSDGDGRTNGEELGDPQCVWTKGQTPPVTTGITHPGVCDPWNEGACVSKNSWLDCSGDETLQCDALNDPEMLNITLRFPRTKVPAKETTYICFNFELPDDREYHLVATKPFIDNRNVMHHIALSRCDGSTKLKSEPEDCLMGDASCQEILEVWALGMSGSCLTPEAGYLIGKGHTRMVSMQFHWTNPSLEDTWYDSSGMVLYYTPRLRRYNAGILTIGQTALAIPPGQNSWVEEGTCTSGCTNKLFSGDIHLFQALHHMHYLGIRQNVTLTRTGGQVEVISDDNPYSYDSPKAHVHNPPVIVRPGDELKTYCTFQSRSRAKTTVYGEGSFDEMCFVFLFYYPQERLAQSTCLQYKEADGCVMYESCTSQIYNKSSPAMKTAIQKIRENCDVTGTTCRVECRQAVAEVKGQNACFLEAWDYYTNVVFQYLSDPDMLKFVIGMQSCDDASGHHGSGGLPTTYMPTRRPMIPSTARPTELPKPDIPEGPGSWLLSLVKHLDARPLLQNIIMNVNYNNYAKAHTPDDHDHDHDTAFH